MLSAPLEGPRRKIQRAKEHIDEFERIVEWYKARKPVGITRYVDEEQGVHRYEMVGLFPPPPELGLRAGEALYQLRSALDHIVYSFGEIAGIDARDARRTEFPIHDDRKVFLELDQKGKPSRRSGLYRIGMLPQRVQDRIESFQPYHRGSARHADPLWVLKVLRDLDTHRSVQPIFAGVRYPLEFGPGAKFKSGDLHDGDVFAEIPSDMNPEEKFEPHISALLTFPPIDVIGTRYPPALLSEIYEHVRVEMMPTLTRLFLQEKSRLQRGD